MSVLTSVFDKICLVYFIIHIPTTLLFDGQAVLPQEWYPQALLDANAAYVAFSKDPFMANPEPWFQALVTCELLFQLPLFFVAIHGYWTRNNSARVPLIVYGAHVATTLVPIFGELYKNTTLEDSEKGLLLSIYMPYFLIPALIVLRMGSDAEPFGHKSKVE